jgi:hypothetical protein
MYVPADRLPDTIAELFPQVGYAAIDAVGLDELGRPGLPEYLRSLRGWCVQVACTPKQPRNRPLSILSSYAWLPPM